MVAAASRRLEKVVLDLTKVDHGQAEAEKAKTAVASCTRERDWLRVRLEAHCREHGC
jgi:hypothetical protein